MSKALHHAGALVVGYGGLGLILRKAIQRQGEREDDNRRSKLRAYAAARYPTMTPDPDLDDLDEEEAADTVRGIHPSMLPKQALDSGFGNIANPGARIVHNELTGTHDPAHLALAVAASLAGGYGGWRLADYDSDSKQNVDLDDRIKKAKNLLDSMIHSEMQRTRGIQKTGSNITPAQLFSQHPGISGHNKVTGSDNRAPGIGSILTAAANPGNAIQGIETMWWLWAAAAFALSYKAGKALTDKTDSNRVRITQIKEVAKDRAKARNAPTLLHEGALGKSTTPGAQRLPEPPKPQALAVQSPGGSGTAVDDEDPYAGLLG